MRKIAHLVNPVIVGPSSDLYVAQPITFATMKMAREFARGHVDVDLLTAQYPEDRALIPDGFQATPDLDRSILDMGNFAIKRKFPLLADILDRLYRASEAEYFIYTNVDIALLPNFYITVNALIEAGYDAFVINRRTIPATYQSPAEIPLMYAEAGHKHEGHDCFIFKRAVLPKYELGAVCVGILWVGRVLYWNLACHAGNFQEFKKMHLTFHLGDDCSTQKQKFSDYHAHNHGEAGKIRLALEQTYGRWSENDFWARHTAALKGPGPGEAFVRTIAHIINPVMVSAASDLFVAQPITFATMKMAQKFARGQVEAALFTAQYPDDRALIPDGFQSTLDSHRSILDLGAFRKKRQLPLLADILDRLYQASEAEYFIYTNVDIALLPHFYITINALIEKGYDALVINRRTIPAIYQNPAEIPLMCAEIGEKHEGHDCFVFRRAAYPKYKLGAVCVGAAMVGRVFIWNVCGHAQKFKELKKSHLTFHLGNDLAWQNNDYSDYFEHNKREAARIMLAMESEHGPFEASGLFSFYPLEFNVMNNDRKRLNE